MIKNHTEIRTGLICRSNVFQNIRLPFSVIRKLTIRLIPSGHLDVFTECLEELHRYGIAIKSFLRILHFAPIQVPHECQAVETDDNFPASYMFLNDGTTVREVTSALPAILVQNDICDCLTQSILSNVCAKLTSQFHERASRIIKRVGSAF